MATWREHKGDSVGVRIAFTPPTAEIVPMTCVVTLPIADEIDSQYPGTVMPGRLPLFYWRSNGGPKNPMVRGTNEFELPQYTTVLELGVFMDIRRQVEDDEYQIEETTGKALLQKVVFNISVPEGNINLPRFGERQYTLDASRLNHQKPVVVSDLLFSQSVVNSEISRMEVFLTLNRPIPYETYLSLRDCMNQFVDSASAGRLDTIGSPPGTIKRAILNDAQNQLTPPGALGMPAWIGAKLSAAAVINGAYTDVPETVYPLPGPNFGKKAFPVPVGTRRLRLTYTFNRENLNTILVAAGYPQAWERVFLHFLKEWETGVLDGRLYRDLDVEILDVTYNLL